MKYVFDLERSAKGLRLNRFLHDLVYPERRERFLEQPENAMEGLSEEEKDMVRSMLSESLHAVVSQTLLKRVNGGRRFCGMYCLSATTLGSLKAEDGEWTTRSLTETTLTSDAHNFRIQARLRAWLADELVFERTWDELIPRKYM